MCILHSFVYWLLEGLCQRNFVDVLNMTALHVGHFEAEGRDFLNNDQAKQANNVAVVTLLNTCENLFSNRAALTSFHVFSMKFSEHHENLYHTSLRAFCEL